MKRPAMPELSVAGEAALAAYLTALREETDANVTTIRNYASDLRQFIAWCEGTGAEGQETPATFTPVALATPLIVRYRSHLQHTLRLRPASVNRALISGTLHEGSNTFYMNLRTFPSIFELRGCLRLPTVACWLPYAAEAHPFDIWWRRSIYRSRMPNTLDWPTFRSNIQVNILHLNVRTKT